MEQVHATCIAVDGKGVLLRGPSGAGKSDLALRLIDGGAALVADDRVDLSNDGGRLVASCPANLRGLLEVRGFGIASVDIVDSVQVGLVLDLVSGETVERMPEPGSVVLAGCEVRRLHLDPFETSAAAKVRMVLGQGETPPEGTP